MQTVLSSQTAIMLTLNKYIFDTIVNNKGKLNATEIQSILIIFIFLSKIAKV